MKHAAASVSPVARAAVFGAMASTALVVVAGVMGGGAWKVAAGLAGLSFVLGLAGLIQIGRRQGELVGRYRSLGATMWGAIMVFAALGVAFVQNNTVSF